jgi:hypothetical protein
MPPKPITYNTELERLLKENSEECESLSILHRMSYEKYNRRSNYINIPVIILSSAIGFITGIDLQYDQMNVILGVGSVFVGIIKSVDTYFQLAKRAESHRICSLQFSQISKKIQVELTLHRDQRLTAENMMNIIKTDIKNMQDIAPLIDDDVINVYNAKYRKYKRVKKPNFVNGLTEVKVNPHNNENEYEYASRQGSREASPSNNQNEPRLSSHEPEQETENDQIQLQLPSLNEHILQEKQNSMQNNGFFNPSGQKDDDNHSVDPVQPTIIPTNMTDVNRIITNNIEQSIRKTPSLSFQGNNIPALPYASVASVPVSVPIQQQPNQQLDNLQLLQLLNQLQQQGIGSGILGNQPVQSRSQVQSHAPSPAQPNVPPPNAPSPAPVDVIVPIDVEINNIVGPSVSPAGSVRSSASVPLGTIQTDNSGNQVVNT